MSELKFKKGDQLMVPVKVTETKIDDTDPPGYFVEFTNGREVWVSEAALSSATLVERPLAVGDRVKGTGEHTYTISSIDGDLAVVRYPGGAWLTPLSALRRAEERG